MSAVRKKRVFGRLGTRSRWSLRAVSVCLGEAVFVSSLLRLYKVNSCKPDCWIFLF
jgi:hypothetical protein